MEEFKLLKLNDTELDEKLEGSLRSLRGNSLAGAETSIYIAEKNRRSAEKYSKSTMRLVTLALVVSLIAMLFSIVDYFGDKTWRKEQLETLRKMHSTLRRLLSFARLSAFSADTGGITLKQNGILPDIGPTVLHLMGFEIPKEMTAECLLK